MSKTRFFLAITLLLASSLHAQPTWHAGNLATDVLDLPGKCSATWYDPEALLFPDGNLGFLAQGGQANPCTANVGLDSIFLAKYNGGWQLPAAGSCPTLVGRYADFSCPNQNFAPYQPLASPAIAKVGSRYYMAFSGGNADIRKGHIFWAFSDDGVNWIPFDWDPKPAGYRWQPLIYPLYGDVCATFGIPQLSLTYDPSTDYGPQGTFYLHFNYIHRTQNALDTYTFRFRYSSANPFGLGGGTQVCLNGGARGTSCQWVNHSGAMVFDYDGQPPVGNDPLLGMYGGNVQNLDYGGGSIVWDPSHNDWLRVFAQFDPNLRWQTTTSLSSGIWSAPQTVDMTQFHNQVRALYPAYSQNEMYYGGLLWGHFRGRTGMWLFQPADFRGCSNYFTGLGMFLVGLNFF
ncbi:MAG TPA: hypothetical protein VOA87_00820 [Thermoanaerobaculia bacterium]|nr:hypothetical protein [Thermoanaerobaculia bacterium]